MRTYGGWFSLVLMASCQGQIGLNIDGEALTPEDFNGAVIRIITPESGAYIGYGTMYSYSAEILDAQGNPLSTDLPVTWSSNIDEEWSAKGSQVGDDSLDYGRHDVTAEVELPNGERVAYTSGGVLVQSPDAGTYLGTLSGGTTVQQVPVSCAGGAAMVVDVRAQNVEGTAECVLRFDDRVIPLDFDIEGTIDNGDIVGVARASLFAFSLEFEGTGRVARDELRFDFEGELLGNRFSGDVRAERFSRESNE